MTESFSKFVYGVCCLAVALTVTATWFWIGIVREQDGLHGMAFAFGVVPFLGGGSLLCGVMPSSILFLRSRQRRDLWSLLMSSGSFLAIAGEMAVLCVIPLHGC